MKMNVINRCAMRLCLCFSKNIKDLARDMLGIIRDIQIIYYIFYVIWVSMFMMMMAMIVVLMMVMLILMMIVVVMIVVIMVFMPMLLFMIVMVYVLMVMMMMVMVMVLVQMLVLFRAVHRHAKMRSRDTAFDRGLRINRHAGNTEGVQAIQKALPVRQQFQQCSGQHIPRRAHGAVQIQSSHFKISERLSRIAPATPGLFIE